MNSLQVIEHACAQAMEEAEEETPGWQAAFVSISDPLTVRELCALVRDYVQYAADHGDQVLVDELRRRVE